MAEHRAGAGRPRRHGRVRRRLRYPASCAVCDTALSSGTEAVWDFDHATATCVACADAVAVDGARTGVAGRSARSEGERRRTSRTDEAGEAGEAAPARSQPRSTRRAAADDAGARWDRGAAGEERLGRALDRLAGRTGLVAVLHDRQVPRSRANIDHLVVGPAGVWVIDAKRYRGLLELDDSGPGDSRLVVDGRDRTDKLVGGAHRQVDHVRRALDESGAYRTVPIQAALCFVDVKRRRRSQPDAIGGVLVTWQKDLLRRLTHSGPYDQAWRQSIQNHLATRFRPAGRPAT